MMTFQQLYETHFDDVFRFALWLSRDQNEAEDLASDTFVKAWSRLDDLRTETLKAYLLTITRNSFLNQRARRKDRTDLMEELADTMPGPSRLALGKMDFDRVMNLIGRLSESDRMALVLRAELSLPYAEIARVLEISDGAARVKVHRARRRLLGLYLNQSTTTGKATTRETTARKGVENANQS